MDIENRKNADRTSKSTEGEISKLLLSRFKAGDEDAAKAIFDRYLQRLLALTRQKMSTKLSRRLDPEDVVQSAYRSFFAHAKNGEFVLLRAGDLWRLLAAIAIHKLLGQAEMHSAERRNMSRESPLAEHNELPVADQPRPDELAMIQDTLQRVMESLNQRERIVLEKRLSGETIESIANDLGRTQRTVRRMLESTRLRLEAELLGETER